MKRIVLLLPLLLLAAISALAMFVADDSPDENAEFYFTRLAYTETGFRGRGRWISPDFRCPEFGGGNFFPRQGNGWAMDNPGADCKFMGGIHRLTGLHVYPNPHMMAITDPDLFKFPYAYIVEPGGMSLTEKEASRLREYLLRGGFIHVDDFWGGWERRNFEAQMRKVFPERRFEILPLSHAIFHTFFDINEVIQIPGQYQGCAGGETWEQPDERDPRIYGMSDDNGRLMMVVTYNSDLGDAWEYMDLRCYPEKYSGQAYRLGMNFMIYAMTH
jgi:uncharacterized protein DUF4159